MPLSPDTLLRHALRALARRFRFFTEEITTHDEPLDVLTAEAVSTLRAAFGIGSDVAEMLIVAADNHVSEPWDSAEYPTTYIAQMIQSCKVYIPLFGAFLRARGTDDLAYCLENSLSRVNVYSQSRASNLRPIGWSESVVEPAGWSTTAVREVWYQNIYNSPP